jgi:predicted nucleic acid-binding protein
VTIRAVLDTSVLIGALRHELVFAAVRGYYLPVLSPFIFGELARVRTEIAIKHGVPREVYRERINAAVSVLSRLAMLVDHARLEAGNYTHWLTDPDDEPILATALVGRAQYIVSLNTHDFPPNGAFAGVRYLTPAAFLDEIYRLHPRKRLRDLPDAHRYRFP